MHERYLTHKKNGLLLAEISNLVGPIEMRKEMGATRNQYRSLIEDQIIIAMIDIPSIQSRWLLSMDRQTDTSNAPQIL
tara:strand:+ start:211 stop:444 length:234 start_codon:yes stop_codon:yes gene_type:complete